MKRINKSFFCHFWSSPRFVSTGTQTPKLEKNIHSRAEYGTESSLKKVTNNLAMLHPRNHPHTQPPAPIAHPCIHVRSTILPTNANTKSTPSSPPHIYPRTGFDMGKIKNVVVVNTGNAGCRDGEGGEGGEGGGRLWIGWLVE